VESEQILRTAAFCEAETTSLGDGFSSYKVVRPPEFFPAVDQIVHLCHSSPDDSDNSSCSNTIKKCSFLLDHKGEILSGCRERKNDRGREELPHRYNMG